MGRLAEVALAAGELTTAVQACRDFHGLYEKHGRNFLDDLPADTFRSAEHPAAPIERVEAELARTRRPMNDPSSV